LIRTTFYQIKGAQKDHMKNRFYGDVNDYIKYGILDILADHYNSLGINWYLTDDQHGKQSDGNKTEYFDKEDKWKSFNTQIFSRLKERVKKQQRSITYCGQDNIIDFKFEFCEQLPDNADPNDYEALRNEWHTRAKEHLKKCDLVFFDPDMGVKDQLSKDVVKNSEYCLVKEIVDYNWCDWLVVVFPRHAKRYPTLKTNPIVISAEQQAKKVMVFLYGGMALLYISNTIQARVLSRVFEEWNTTIDTKILVP